jgi:hypothetical protein
LFVLSSACTDTGNNENVFKTQVDAVDKAKEVEGKIMDAAQQQRQAIEEDTE